jgi:glycylpeptide N-tetradecanoyltransferase
MTEINKHKSWNTQRVPTTIENITPGPIELLEASEAKQEPYKLPEGFEWCIINWEDDKMVEECYSFLKNNYADDISGVFVLNYSKEFLKWYIINNCKKEWQLCIRSCNNNKLCAMVIGILRKIIIDEKIISFCELNFLCIHPKLRNKRLTPVLMKEMSRRVQISGVFHAIYTSSLDKPTPICKKVMCWHRPLNVKKLIDTGFLTLSKTQTLSILTKLMSCPVKVATSGWKKFEICDAEHVLNLFNTSKKFKLSRKFENSEEIINTFLYKENVVSSFVIKNNGIVTDFASFYQIDNHVKNNSKHDTLKMVYCYYCIPTTVTLSELVKNLIIEANIIGIDVFNSLDLINHGKTIKDNKFIEGNGGINYYLYNYALGSEYSISNINIILC